MKKIRYFFFNNSPIGHVFLALITLLLFVTVFDGWFLRSGYNNSKENLVYSKGISLPSPQEYLLNYDGQTYDVDWLYFGDDPKSVEYIKSADVLFMGTSFCTFIFQTQTTQRFFESYGLKYNNLCINHLGRVPAEEIIKKYQLHPKVVVFFLDYFMVLETHSEEYYKAINISQFDSIKRAYLAESTVYFQHLIHRFIPYVRDLFQDKYLLSLGGPARIVYTFRSRLDGTHRVYFNEEIIPIHPLIDYNSHPSLISDTALGSLQEFKSYLTEHNIQLILSSDDTLARTIDVGTAQWYAQQLNVPLAIPDLSDIPPNADTIDGDHLIGESAHAFNNAYLNALKPHIQKISPLVDQNKGNEKVDISNNKIYSIQGFTGEEINGNWDPIKPEYIQTTPSMDETTPNFTYLPLLLDGNLQTSWTSAALSNVKKEYLLLKFASPNSIARVRWYPVAASKIGRTCGNDFEIYTGNDVWRKAADVRSYTSHDGEWVNALISPQRANLVILYFTLQHNCDTKQIPLQIAEVTVDSFNPSLPTPPRSSFFSLSWIVPEYASSYDLRWSYEPIISEIDWEKSFHIPSALPAPSSPGLKDSIILELQGLIAYRPIYFGLRVQNTNGELSDLSNVIKITKP